MAVPRVALLGVGGVGGWVGARLLEAGRGAAEVVLIARGAHGAAVRERGLRLHVAPPDGATRVVETGPGAAEVYSSVAEAVQQKAKPVDFVILGVKTWQVKEAAAEAEKLLADGGCVVTTQNGVEAPAQAAESVGSDRVLAGVAKVLAFIAEPGVVEMKETPASLHFGEAFAADGRPITVSDGPAAVRSARADWLAAALAKCKGIDSGVASKSMWSLIWEKAVIMCCMGPVGALTRAPVDRICGIPETRRVLEKAMVEVSDCAAKAGHLSPEDTPGELAARTLRVVEAHGIQQPGITPSTLRDVVMGRPSEINELTGGIVRSGRALGVPTPTHDLILALLLPQELRARGEQPYQLNGVPGGAPHVSAGSSGGEAGTTSPSQRSRV